jgi:hypothetical protein
LLLDPFGGSLDPVPINLLLGGVEIPVEHKLALGDSTRRRFSTSMVVMTS